MTYDFKTTFEENLREAFNHSRYSLAMQNRERDTALQKTVDEQQKVFEELQNAEGAIDNRHITCRASSTA